MGDLVSSENPISVVMDAPVHVTAEFVEVAGAAGEPLVSWLGGFLLKTGYIASGYEVLNLEFDRGGAGAARS